MDGERGGAAAKPPFGAFHSCSSEGGGKRRRRAPQVDTPSFTVEGRGGREEGAACGRYALASPSFPLLIFILMWSNKVIFLLHFLFRRRSVSAEGENRILLLYADTQMQTFREKVQKQQLLSLLFFFFTVCLSGRVWRGLEQ